MEQSDHAYARCVTGEGVTLVRAWGEHAWAYGDDPVLCEGPGEGPGTVRTVHASGAVRTWDERTGAIVAVKLLPKTEDSLGRAVCSRDGTRAFVWDASSTIEGAVYDLNAGTQIASCWLPREEYETFEFMGRDEPVLDGFTLGAEQVVARGCLDRDELRFLARWEVRTGALVEWARVPDSARPVGLEPPYEARYEARDGVLVRRGGSDESDAHGALRAFAFAPSGNVFATAGDRSGVRVWDARTGAQRWALEGAAGGVRGLALAPDERRVYAVTREHFVTWDLATGLLVDERGFAPTVRNPERSRTDNEGPEARAEGRGVWVSPDGAFVVIERADTRSLGTHSAACYALATWQQQWKHDFSGVTKARVLGYTADGDGVGLSLDAGLRYREVAARRRATVAEVGARLPRIALEVAPATLAGVSRASLWVVAGGSLWSLSGGKTRRVDDTPPVAAPLFVSPRGAFLLTGTPSGDALIWSVSLQPDGPVTARPVATVLLAAHFDRVRHAAFDAREETLVLSTERGVLLTLALTR